MNSKIIEKLEYNRIIKQLSDLAITAPAKEQALTLMPSSNFDEVKKVPVSLDYCFDEILIEKMNRDNLTLDF